MPSQMRQLKVYIAESHRRKLDRIFELTGRRPSLVLRWMLDDLNLGDLPADWLTPTTYTRERQEAHRVMRLRILRSLVDAQSSLLAMHRHATEIGQETEWPTRTMALLAMLDECRAQLDHLRHTLTGETRGVTDH